MTAFNDKLDTARPAGSDDPAEADDRMREIKAAVQERENVDHYWPLTGTEVSDVDTGEHRKVTLRTGSAPSAVADAVVEYAKDVGGKAEKHIKDEDGNEIQLTSKGQNLANNAFLTGTNAAGTGSVSLIKAGTNDLSTLPDGAEMASNAAPTEDEGIVNKKYVDFSAWTTEDADAATLAAGTTYTATSDGFVSLYATKTPVTVLKQTVVYGGITTVLRSISSGNTDHHISGTFSVASGETFVITDNTGGSTTVINWRSVGTLSKPTK